ncbi:MAG: hypothetical protein ABI321_14360 [Polyangia bacterium]
MRYRRWRKASLLVGSVTVLALGFAGLWRARLETQHGYELDYLAQRVAVMPCDKESLNHLLVASRTEPELERLQVALIESSVRCPYAKALAWAPLLQSPESEATLQR